MHPKPWLKAIVASLRVAVPAAGRSSGRNGRRAFGVSIAAAAIFVVSAATPAYATHTINAGNSGNAIPRFPDTVTVGQTFNAQLGLGIIETNANFESAITNISLIPSCSTTSPSCAGGAIDPDVFALSAQGVGAPGTACAGQTFAITPDPGQPGRYNFTPLVPPTPPLLSEFETCDINFQVTVLSVPNIDVSPGTPGVQTNQIGFGLANPIPIPGDNVIRTPFNLHGTDEAVVLAATPIIQTFATPQVVDVGEGFSDTAVVTGVVNGPVPTGNVTFRLYGPTPPPGFPSCTGPALLEQTLPLAAGAPDATGRPTANAGPFNVPPQAAGNYVFVATYSGDANYTPVTGVCDDPAERVSVLPLPTIVVVKTADPLTRPEPGGTFRFTVVVTNTSPEPVTITSLVDNRFGNLDDPANPLVTNSTCLAGVGTVLPADPVGPAPGGSFTCAFDAQVIGDASDPAHVDIVTAVAVDADGNQATDDDDAVVDLTDVLPTIVVDKTVLPGTLPEPGGTFRFTVVVRNTSPEPVTITSLVDDRFGNLDDPANPLVTNSTCLTGVGTVLPADPAGPALGGSFTCAFDAQVIGDASDPPHVDVVTSTAVDNEGNTATDDDDAVVNLTDVLPTIAVDKTVAPGTRPEPGGTFRFTAVVRNTSPEPVTITSLVDNRFGSLTNPANPLVTNSTCLNALGTVLAADPDGAGPQLGGSYTCAFDAQVIGEAEDPPHVDVITAVAVDNEGNTATDDDDATVLLTDILPLIDVNKSVSPGSLPEPGGTFRFSVVVTNSGPDAVVITSMVDDRFGDLDDPDNPLVSNSTCLTGVGTRLLPDPDGAGPQPPGTFSCEFDAEVIGDASDPAHVDVVTAVAEDDEGNTTTDNDDASVDLTDLLPIIAVEKTANPTSVPEPGGAVEFTVVVRNVGPDDVTITELTDDVFGDLDDPANPLVSNSTCLTAVGTALAADPDGAGPGLGGSFTCTFTADVEGDATDPPHVDTVTGDAEDSEGNPTTDSDDATVTFTEAPPTVLVVKTAAPETRPAPGGTFTFTVVVTNTSAEDVTITSLTDDIYGNIATQGTCTTAIGTVLAPDETYSCTFDGNFAGPGSQTDVVTVIVTDDDDQTATDDDDATVTVTPVPPAEVVRQNLVTPPNNPIPASPTSTTTTQSQGPLPKTGAGVTDLVALAAGLVAMGTLLLLTGSRWGQGAPLVFAAGAGRARTVWSRRRTT